MVPTIGTLRMATWMDAGVTGAMVTGVAGVEIMVAGAIGAAMTGVVRVVRVVNNVLATPGLRLAIGVTPSWMMTWRMVRLWWVQMALIPMLMTPPWCLYRETGLLLTWYRTMLGGI
jgi:hypothetical protein